MAKNFQNYYELLSLPSSATLDEIRRAYRILARRYHPDVNPGKASEEKFKAIAEAYSILSDAEKRAQFDVELHAQLKSRVNPRIREYGRQQGARRTARERYEAFEKRIREAQAEMHGEQPQQRRQAKPKMPFGDLTQKLTSIKDSLLKTVTRKASGTKRAVTDESRPKMGVNRVSILEISVSMKDAIRGVRRTVEISEPEGRRKISVTIPPGVRTGSVLRFRDKGGSGEELVFIVRVASHPYLNIETKGLVVDVPVSVGEAFSGASLTLPTLEEPAVVKLPPLSQSGAEIRVKGKGIQTREGGRGDLFYRIMIRLPDSLHAVGIKEKVGEIEGYYSGSVRQALPKSLLEFE